MARERNTASTINWSVGAVAPDADLLADGRAGRQFTT
jgi:hypothetical protein